MEELILLPRVIPPKLPDNIIHRKELSEKLSANRGRQLIIVNCPAGYGKTTLIVDFLEKSKLKYGWFQIHNDISNVYSFFSYLIHSIKRLDQEFGDNTLKIIQSTRERYQLPKQFNQVLNLLLSTFINEFSRKYGEDIYIVLDELEQLDKSEWINETLEKLLYNLQPNLHFIITTRELPEVNLSTLTAKQKVFKLLTNDLEFTNDEVREVLKNYFDSEYNEDEITSLVKNMGGWVTGIHLLLQSLGKDFAKFQKETNAIPEDIYSYFAEDITKGLGEEVRNFLLETSPLEDFTISDCNELLDIENSKDIITELLNKNIFIISSSSAGETKYNYQVLFKKYLNLTLSDEKSSKDIQGLYKRISKFYKGKGENDKAIRYLLIAKDFEKAAGIIEETFTDRFDEGNFEIIWQWLDMIPEDIFNKYPILLYQKGLMTKFYTGDLEGAVPFMIKAIKLFKSKGDEALLVRANISLVRIYISTGEINKAMTEIRKMLKNNLTKENEAKLIYLLAYGHYVKAEYEKSHELLEKALTLEESGSLADIRNHAYNLLGNINLIKGEFIKSITYYEKALLNDFNVIEQFETYCNLVLLYSQSGNFEKANEYLHNAKEMCENTPIPIFLIAFSLAEQAYHFEKGNYKESINILLEMNNLAQKHNHKYYTYLSYRLIADSYYYLKKYKTAEEYYDLAFEYMNEDSELEVNEFAHMKALLAKETNLRSDIEVTLKSALDFYIENGLTYNEIQAAYHLADYYLKAGKEGQAMQFIGDVIKTSYDKEYYSFLRRELMFSPALFDFCNANKIEKNLIKDLKESILETYKTSPESSPAVIKQSISKDTDTLTDLKMLTFGGLSFYKRSEKVDDKLWQKKKRKMILAYLLLSPGKQLTKDQIVDIFYPDTPFESVENIFYQSISRIRKILSLNNEETKGKHNSMIIYKDKVLSQDPDFMYYIDSVEFEELCKKAGASNTKNDEKIDLYKKALDLYEGNFMEGYYDDWVEEKRQSLTNKFYNASTNLLELLSKQKRNNEIITYANKVLNTDKLNEYAYEELIRSHIENSNKNAAEKTYKDMMRNFRKETGDEPEKDFLDKINSMLV